MYVFIFFKGDIMNAILEKTFWGNTVYQWAVALIILIVLHLILTLIKRWLVKRFESGRMFVKSDLSEILGEIFKRTRSVVLFLVALYVACRYLVLPSKLVTIIGSVAFIGAVIQVGLWGHYLIHIGLTRYMGRKMKDPSTSSGITLMSLFGRVVLWSFVLLVILENMGVNITTLIASLGVGGIAIGLATQNILSDLFASLSILLDKPFEVGHFIIVDDKLGTVEKIGLKTTRVRSLSGELLVFGNNDLLSSRIRNYTMFQERRVLFSFGVLYSTASGKLKKIPDIVREIINNVEQTRFDRTHFKEFGNFSLNFEVVYYIQVPDYAKYMDVQQAINLALFEAFEKEGIEFAFPTQTIHLAGKPAQNITSHPA